MQNRENYDRVIADFTRTRLGFETNVVSLLKQLRQEYSADPSALTVIVQERQREFLGTDFQQSTVLVSSVSGVRPLVLSIVRGVEGASRFLLVSYGRDVLELESEDKRITSLSFGRYRLLARRGQHFVVSTTTVKPQLVVETSTPEPAAPVPQVPVEPEPAVAVTEPEQEKHRSRMFGKLLERSRLGPFADHRPLVYDAIERILAGGDTPTVSELLDRAVRDAQGVAAERDAASQLPHQVSPGLWTALRKCFEQLALNSEVFKSEGDVRLGADWRSRTRPVTGVVENWRAVIDAQLILGLIDQREDVSSLDVKDIARAIYHSSSPDSQERVNAAVVFLLDKGLVDEPQGFLRRTQAKPHLVKKIG